MTTETMPTGAPVEPVEPVTAPDATEPEDGATAPPEPAEEPQSFDADYVKDLRAKAAEARVKAKRADALAAQAVAAIVRADGRLIDADLVEFTEDLIGTDGLIDAGKVAEHIAALVQAKPYLRRQTPTTPISQGVLPEPVDSVGLFARMRGGV